METPDKAAGLADSKMADVSVHSSLIMSSQFFLITLNRAKTHPAPISTMSKNQQTGN